MNSGSRNLGGLERMADLLADAFAALPGVIRLENPATVEAVDSAGPNDPDPAWPAPSSYGPADCASAIAVHRPHGHSVRRRSRIPANALARRGRPRRSRRGRHEGRNRGDAARRSRRSRKPRRERIGYEVVINSDEEVGSARVAPPCWPSRAGKRAALTYDRPHSRMGRWQALGPGAAILRCRAWPVGARGSQSRGRAECIVAASSSHCVWTA